jgi:DDE superfamily endonuclease
VGGGKKTAAALGAWIVFEDETGQSMRPPRARTWAPRGHPPVIRVRQGGTGSVSVAGLACYRPGFRTRLICRYHQYHGRKGEKKAFTWQEYRDLITAAHRQLPGGKIVLVWDNLNTHAQAENLALGSRTWLHTCRLPPYAPDLNPLEGIWSVIKRGPLANLSCPAFSDLVRVLQRGLRTIQRRPRLIEGCLAETGLTLETA